MKVIEESTSGLIIKIPDVVRKNSAAPVELWSGHPDFVIFSLPYSPVDP